MTDKHASLAMTEGGHCEALAAAISMTGSC